VDLIAKEPSPRSHDAVTEDTKSQSLPDHLSNDPRSPYYNAEILARDVGVRFKGVEKTNVAEYCISEGWIRVEAGKTKDRHGNPLLIKLTGPVEVYFKDERKD
jgi:Protein of unknown function (DUF3297)